MRLKQFDLNLLVILDALLKERSTTRAAVRVNLSQPSVSNALSRLRRYFQDDLLVQVGQSLMPTTLGQSLAGPVHDLVVRAGATLDRRPGFDPTTASRTFTLMASDYVAAVVFAEMTRRAELMAPALKFEFRPMVHPADEQIARGDIDLLVMPDVFLNPQHERESLYAESFVCVVWKGNTSVRGHVSLEQLLAMHHVVAAPGAAPFHVPTILDRWFEQHLGGQSRKIDVWVADFSAVPQYIQGTQRAAIIQRRLASLHAERYELQLLELPVEMPPLNIAMQWHRHRNSDSGVCWLRDFLRTIAKGATAVAMSEAATPRTRRSRAGTAHPRK